MLYNIYVGINSLDYIGTLDATEDEAWDYAWEEAKEQYESYSGLHGITSWDECYNDIQELYQEEIDVGEYDESDLESMTNEEYTEIIQSWMQYNVIKMEEDKEFEEEMRML